MIGGLRRTLGVAFRRAAPDRSAARLGPDSAPARGDRDPASTIASPDLIGELDRRLDAARTRLQATIPPPPE
jgi:hypothetical protein